MNLKIETHLYLAADNWTPEEIARIGLAFSDTLVSLGYENVAAEDPEETKLTSVVIIKGTEPEAWKTAADDPESMSVSFPTTDLLFAQQADAGGIIE